MSRRFLAAVVLAIALPAWPQQLPKLEPLPELPPPPPGVSSEQPGEPAVRIHSGGSGVLPGRGPGRWPGSEKREPRSRRAGAALGDPPVLTLAPTAATARASCLSSRASPPRNFRPG